MYNWTYHLFIAGNSYMSQEQANQFLVQGINAAKAGQKDQAKQLFQNALRLDPRNETAWLW